MNPQRSHRLLFKPVEDCTSEGCHADIYLPEHPVKAPVYIMIHGGAFVCGASTDIPPDQVTYLLSQGIAVISLEYRLAPHVSMAEIREDLVDGYAWVQTRMNDEVGIELDVGRCVLAGWSAGGTSVLLMDRDIQTHSPALVRPLGLIPTYPLVDPNAGFASPESAFKELLTKVDPERYELAMRIHEEEVCCGVENHDFGPPPDFPWVKTPRDAWCAYMCLSGALNAALHGHEPPFTFTESLILNVRPSHSPTFVICAEADTLIDPDQSRRYHARLKELSVECEIREAVGMWHGIAEKGRVDWPDGVKWWEEAILPSLEWAVRKLRA